MSVTLNLISKVDRFPSAKIVVNCTIIELRETQEHIIEI